MCVLRTRFRPKESEPLGVGHRYLHKSSSLTLRLTVFLNHGGRSSLESDSGVFVCCNGISAKGRR